MPRQRSRSPLSPTLATESATVRLFICVGVLKAGLKTETGFCTVCDFAHARPIMLSILLVKKDAVAVDDVKHLEIIGASVSEHPLPTRPSCPLSVCLYIYIVRTFRFGPAEAHALRANVAGQIGNRFSPAESAFSACIGSGSSQSS